MELIKSNFKKVKYGLVLMLTNDDTYKYDGRDGVDYTNFSMSDGNCQTRIKHWYKKDSSNLEKHASQNFEVEREYLTEWHDQEIDGITFHYCIVTV